MQAYVLIKGVTEDLRLSIVETLLADGFAIDVEKTVSYGICVMERANQTVVLANGKTLSDQEIFASSEPTNDASYVVVGDGEVSDVVNALLDGADAYLRKPLNPRELLSRIRALFRRIESRVGEENATPSDIEIANMIPAETLRNLTSTEARLLGYMVSRKERLIAHDELMRAVWGRKVDKGRLRYYIHSLRKKLTEEALFQLKTHSGFGYLLLDSAPSVN